MDLEADRWLTRINEVSCASTALCVAVDDSGKVITSANPTAGAAAVWTPASVDPGFAINGVSCPTATLCVAVDGSARVITSTNPTGGSGAWTNKFTVGAAGAFYRIDCPSTTLCVAVDGAGEVATSMNPTAGAGAWGVMDIDGTNALFSVGSNAFLCVAGDQDGNVLASNNPTVPGTWHSTDLGSNTTTDSPFGVACPSSTLCLAADNGGKAWRTTAPLANPAVWTGIQKGASLFTGLMCPSTTLCVAPTNSSSVVIGTPAKPTVLTLAPPSNITASGATLHGKVDPRESNVTNCRFDLGPSSGSYNATAACNEAVGSGLGAVNVSATPTGLPPNTTFHYRLQATNANGTGFGIDQSFTTATSITEVSNTGRPQISGTPQTGSELEIINNLSLFTGCDIGRYYSLGHGKPVRAAAAGSTAFDVPPKAGPTLFSIEGAGAAPHVKLHSPSGEVFDFTDATGDTGKPLPGDAGWGTVIDSEDRTVAIIPRAKSGTWTAEVADGSPAVSRVRLAPILEPAALKAHVSGRGTHRVLSYLIAPQAGQTVRFTETAPGGLKVLKTIRGGGKAALGSKYLVRVDYGSGNKIVLTPNPGVRRVNVPNVRRGEGLRILVFASSAAGRRGPAAKTKLKGSMLVGGVKKTPLYHPPKHKKKRKKH